jgi:hypothetical protein
MFDFAHRLTLKAAARGTADDSPALRNLIASRLVEEADRPGEYRLTTAGQAALEADRPTRFDRFLSRLTFGGLLLLAIGFVGGWLAG